MDELDAVALRVGTRLIARGETIAISESSAGGLISAALLAVPGASAFFMGGAVVYTLKAREVLLGITAGEMTERGIRSASEPYAALCASRVRERFATSWGLSETGAAGPTGNRYGDAAGHACFALSGPAERVTTLETGHGDRARNMRVFAAAALALLEAELG
ncbi:CinA family protein [Enterovirga rhinocerotis]|uniref:Competence/damage-inducible protein cinA n=1 Tax=Enterovirga rhinocerotis TaxID=1339210 RepID=A0A4R7BWK8_9HYPH|nr:CinA family protein [Enterovirga rhinocerotis]TDR89883.1 competence/damage-inducible protein cinA [Enterovirga rhinocerotis]